MSSFEIFIIHAVHCGSSSFFPLKKTFCVINIIQFHFSQNSIRFYLRRKEIKKTLNPSRIFDNIFWPAFVSSLYLTFANNLFLEQLDSLANFTFFSMSSRFVEWRCDYSTLPSDGSRHYRITLAADFFRVYNGLSLDMYTHKIYFLNFVFIVFFIVIFFPQKLTTDSI